MKEEIRLLMREALHAELEPLWDQLTEQNARISAHGLLLETLYANAFLNDPAGLIELMQGLIEKTRSNATRAGPMSDEQAIELQARIATRLQRFSDAVQLRLQQSDW